MKKNKIGYLNRKLNLKKKNIFGENEYKLNNFIAFTTSFNVII